MKFKKMIAIGLAAGLAVSALTGCSIKTDTPFIGHFFGLKDNQVFKVGDLICTKPEYMIRILDTAKKTSKGLGGNVNWDNKVSEEKTLEDYVLDSTKEYITAKYAVSAMATANGISLTTDEQEKADSDAEKSYNALTSEEKEFTGAKEGDMKKLFTNLRLADKAYKEITDEVKTTISDEDARVCDVQYIRMSIKKSGLKKIKKKYKEIKEVVEGEYQKFDKEAKQYSEDENYDLTIKKNEAKSKLEKEAVNVTTGTCSKPIVDGDNVYLVYCVKGYDKKATAANKKALIDAKKKIYFDQKYADFLNSVERDFNSSAVKGIDLSSIK